MLYIYSNIDGMVRAKVYKISNGKEKKFNIKKDE
jgi:hypothetical protein